LRLFCAAPAKLDRKTAARRVIKEARVMMDSCLGFNANIYLDSNSLNVAPN